MQIGSAHFYREGIPPPVVNVYNGSLISAIACALGYRLKYATLGYNLTNYEKTDFYCTSVDSHVELQKKCDYLINVGQCDSNNK